MNIEDILSRFEGVEQSSPDSWMARCPAHGDSNPSLSITLKPDGKVLMHCFTGCTVEEICAAVGLKMSDLMPERPKVERTPKKKRDLGKWVCDYVYQDEDGADLYKIARYEKDGLKTFVHLRPNPENRYGWDYGIHDKKTKELLIKYRCPFHLPRVVAAAKAGKVIFILEGEKDVLNFEKATGCAATCNSGGALKWGEDFPDNWGEWFAGAKGIVIIADNDPETKTVVRKYRGQVTSKDMPHWKGQKHAADVRAKLIKVGFPAEKIKLMVMPGVEIEQGVTKRVKDFSDWAEARKAAGLAADKAAFQAAYKAAEAWPDKWNFSEEELSRALAGFTRAEKRSARQTASEGSTATAPAPEEKSAGAQTASSEAEEFSAAGRFGRPSPLSPSEKERWFVVDYQINAGKIARFEIGVNHFRFEGWKKSDNDDETKGKFVKDTKYSAMEGELTQFFGLAIGCCTSFDAHFKVSGPVRIELVSSIALAWLRARGKFFADKNNPIFENSMFFDSAQGVLYLLHSNEFSSFLATVTNINREDKLFKYMVSLIDDLALNDEYTPRVIPAKQWARNPDENDEPLTTIYISNGDSQVCKVTGGKFELVPNGTDDVLFIRGATLAPWAVEDGPGVDPFKDSMLFKLAALEKETDRMNCRLWWLNLFACHKNKPILLVTGPKGSGKTRLLQGMKQFLGMREDGKPDDTVNDIDPTDKGLDAFWVIEDRGRFEIFDNFDSKIKWAENAFQTAATNGSAKRRELYKSKALVTLSANAYMGVTSNNPTFTTMGGGLPDRIITARIGSGRKVSVGDELRRDIVGHRNQYMTWLVRTLMVALADDKPVDGSINRRHPDYGAFAVRCGRAFGDEPGAIHAMEAAELDKALLPLLNDTVAKEIVAVLRAQEPVGSMRFTSSEMSDAIINRLGDDESDDNTKSIYGARRIGKAIKKLEREFSMLFKWTSGTVEGRTRYEFMGLTTQGDLVFGASGGGFGGFGGLDSGKVPTGDAHAGEFSEINAPNPSNPPYARAQAQSDFSAVKGKDNGELGDNGLDDDDFDPEDFELW